MILPWVAPSDEFGTVLCHPTMLDTRHHDRDLFVLSFQGALFDTKRQKQFSSRFPSLNHNSPLLEYLNHVVAHGVLHKVYVPPVHTLRYDEMLGA